MDVSQFVSTFGGFTAVKPGTLISDALVLSGVLESRGEAKRAFKAGMVRVHCFNNAPLTDRPIESSDGEWFFLLCGKQVRIVRVQ